MCIGLGLSPVLRGRNLTILFSPSSTMAAPTLPTDQATLATMLDAFSLGCSLGFDPKDFGAFLIRSVHVERGGELEDDEATNDMKESHHLARTVHLDFLTGVFDTPRDVVRRRAQAHALATSKKRASPAGVLFT